MPFSYLIALVTFAITAGGFTIWLGFAAGAAAALPFMIAALSLRLWLAQK